MGRIKLAVRAQRKFAHKVFIPNVSDGKCDTPPEKREQETAPAPPILVNNPISVFDLLDQVAFRNIHAHVDERVPDPIKDVRIVLKRLPPIRNGISNKPNTNNAAEDNTSEASPISSPNRKSEENKNVSNSSRQSIPVQHSTRSPRLLATKNRGIKKVLVRTTKSATKSSAIKNMKQMKLRNRTISRKLMNANLMQKVIRAKRSVTNTLRRASMSSRRASETSIEDNRPLTYFVSNKVNTKGSVNPKATPNKERQTQTRTMSIRKRLIAMSTRTSRSSVSIPLTKTISVTQTKPSASLLKKKSLAVIKDKPVALRKKVRRNSTESKVLIENGTRSKSTAKKVSKPVTPEIQKRITRYSDGTILKRKQEDQSPLSSPTKTSDEAVTKRGSSRKTSRDSGSKVAENGENTSKHKEPKLLLKPIDKSPERRDSFETGPLRPTNANRRNIAPKQDLEQRNKLQQTAARKSEMPSSRVNSKDAIDDDFDGVSFSERDSLTSVQTEKTNGALERVKQWLVHVRPEPSRVTPEPIPPAPETSPAGSKSKQESSKPAVKKPQYKRTPSNQKANPKPVQSSRNINRSVKSQATRSVSNGPETEFKMPETPRKRTVRVAKPAASNTPQPHISPRERDLRKRCTAWNYKRLGCLQTKPDTIRHFCTECSRCKLLFKPATVKGNPKPGLSRPGCSSTDVYEFEERDDDSRNIAPYSATRGSRPDENQSTSAPVESDPNPVRSTLLNISKQPNYVEKLKEFMTPKGKKFLRATSLVNSNGDGDQPRDEAVLAQVIGILMDCEMDADETESTEQTANRPQAEGQSKRVEEEPKPGSSRRCLSPETELSRKRTRHSHHHPASQIGCAALRVCRKFSPSDTEFAEGPTKYAARILQMFPGIGLCGIKPPHNFTPSCVINNTETPFKMNNQYVHRMFQRWGPATKELTVIRSVQDAKVQGCPLFDGIEVDLVKLHQIVQEANGIEALQTDHQKWSAIMHKLGFRSSTKPTKLQSIYYKCLLDYDILTCEQRDKQNSDVEKCWAKREAQAIARARDPLWRQKKMKAGMSLDDDDAPTHLETVCAEAEECVAPGRNGTIKSFKKIANLVQGMYFPNRPNPTADEVEVEFWAIVMSASPHVCVHSASVDTSTHDCGFTADRSEPYGDHPWNLKRLSVSSTNLLSYLGPMPGVSSTTLHFGMAFTTSCWHMDPTAVPYIEYLHSGPPKIWYSISADQAEAFRTAAEALCPAAVQNKDIWLPCDILMVPPKMLQQQGITVSRHVQHAGEYVVVYPKSYCACIDTGYTVSEGVYFAPHTWLNNAESIYLNLRNSCEPSLFPMEKLLISMAKMQEGAIFLLQRVHTMLQSMLRAELVYRQKLAGRSIELMSPAVFQEQNRRASRASWQLYENGECAYCRCHLYLSRVIGLTKGQTGVCSMHGVHLFEQAVARGEQLTGVYCILLVSNVAINSILDNLQQRIRKVAATQARPSRS